MKDNVPRGNGTLCRVLGVKLRENAPSHRVKNYYGKKVWTVNAKHVQWLQCEHVNIPGHIVQLETQIYELEKGQKNNENKSQISSCFLQYCKSYGQCAWIFFYLWHERNFYMVNAQWHEEPRTLMKNHACCVYIFHALFSLFSLWLWKREKCRHVDFFNILLSYFLLFRNILKWFISIFA